MARPQFAPAMTLLARLRHTAAGLLGRVVLAWFALTLGVAAGASMAPPTALQGICTSAGSATLVLPNTTPHGLHLNCPMCLTVVPPPPTWAGPPAAAPAAPHPPLPAAGTPLAAQSVVVPPVRGPPPL